MKKVSLIASAVRTPLYQMFLDSLKGSGIEIEVIFAGHVKPDIKLNVPDNVTFVYVKTGKIKPAQCYEIARRKATGELICWVADDCEFIGGVIDKAYAFWKSLNNRKAVLSIQTCEHYGHNTDKTKDFCNMSMHSFYGKRPETPLMAPLGLLNRDYLEELGGLDRRYLCGQYENDIVMRVYADGGVVVPFGDKTAYIDIDHIGKESIVLGRQATREDFGGRPFQQGYWHDREILETSWCGRKGGSVRKVRADEFEPFEETDLLLKSQSYKGSWE